MDKSRVLAESMNRETERMLKLGISRVLGREDFTPDELRGRLHAVEVVRGDTTYNLDGVPFLVLGPMQFKMTGTVCNLVRGAQFLGPAATE